MRAFWAHARERIGLISHRDIKFILSLSVACALLAIPFLHNIGIFVLLEKIGVTFTEAVAALFVLSPIGLFGLSICLVLLPLHHHSAGELSRYAVIGIFNVLLNAAIFNGLIIVSGISQGPLVTLFALISFALVITQSFYWNSAWTFQHRPSETGSGRYVRFFAVTSTTALINLGIIQILVNVIGAPEGVSAPLWANIALLITIVTAVIGNFIGYKLFVFAQ